MRPKLRLAIDKARAAHRDTGLDHGEIPIPRFSAGRNRHKSFAVPANDADDTKTNAQLDGIMAAAICRRNSAHVGDRGDRLSARRFVQSATSRANCQTAARIARRTFPNDADICLRWPLPRHTGSAKGANPTTIRLRPQRSRGSPPANRNHPHGKQSPTNRDGPSNDA